LKAVLLAASLAATAILAVLWVSENPTSSFGGSASQQVIVGASRLDEPTGGDQLKSLDAGPHLATAVPPLAGPQSLATVSVAPGMSGGVESTDDAPGQTDRPDNARRPSTSQALVLSGSPSGQVLPATYATNSSSLSPPVTVPHGERLPALFYDERALPPPQRQALDRIANEFIDSVGEGGAGSADWAVARERADRQYLILYGHAAFHARHLQSAQEAVAEQRLSRPAANQ
jgi:hypothetical protein